MATSVKERGTTVTKLSRRNGNAAAFDLEAPKPGRSRVPELAVGVLPVAVFGLASLWWFTSATEKTQVLATADSVERGQILELEDLIVVSINSDDSLATIDRLDASSIVGRVALTDLPARMLVTSSQFAADDALAVGEGLVGMELEAGQVPALRLLPGNRVSVVLTPRQGSTEDLTNGGALEQGELLVDGATVVETVAVGSQGRQFVSLSMTETEAQTVAVAASQDRVRLIQVARDDVDESDDVESDDVEGEG